MKNTDNFTLERQSKHTQEIDSLDLTVILPIVLKHWYWFLISIALALLASAWYIRHTMPVYRTTATILVNERDDRALVDNSDLLQGLGLPGGMKNIQNQIMLIKSRALTERTLSELPFEVEYYFKTIRNQLPVYPELPVKVVSDSAIPLPKDIEFALTFQTDSIFILESKSEIYPLLKTASFGQNIEVQGGSFMIECRDYEWLGRNIDRKLYFKIHSRRRLTNAYGTRLNVELVSREGSVLRISLEGTNRAKDVDFLNKHIEGFQAISLDKKNAEAHRRIQFIDDQLVGISDSLSLTENRLQQFRSSNRVMDLSAQGQSIIGQVTLLENERARLNLEANYYDYLADYLEKDATAEMPIVPVTMGISDQGLTRLVNELTELQGQLTARGAGEMNPLQRNLELRIRTSKDALKETLNGLRRANSLARSENQQQINRANAQAAALPVTERQLLGIERKFELNNELYTFLLETRAEQEMQKASNRADSEVIDPADERFSVLVSPKKAMVTLIALFLGFAVPLFSIILGNLFNKKLKDEDIRRITDYPIVGNIPHNTDKNNTVVFDNPTSSVAEAFRLLRSKMQFFTKDAKAPVILVTSTLPGDGKTFAAMNLASVCSLLGKKTILIGFDLRKPRIYQDFGLQNDRGVSTWLIGKDSIQDIIQRTKYDNFSVITAGPIPPNPSELTALEKTQELLKHLKEKYDYILIDSSPIGIVSDTYYLASMSDACLVVVRPGKTIRDAFISTLSEISSAGIKGVSLVINDIQSDSKHYGYGERYGYTSDKEHSKKRSIFKRRSKRK
jgi:capsular exopolysaccharide synthesis family protein